MIYYGLFGAIVIVWRIASSRRKAKMRRDLELFRTRMHAPFVADSEGNDG